MIPKDNNLYELSTILWTLTYNKRKYIKKDLSFEKTDNNHQKTHLAVRAFTWNHLYSIGQDFNNCQMFDLPLEELTESIYRSLKIARRSWGDYGRPTNRRKSIAQGIFFSTTTTLLIVIIYLFILNYFKL